MPEEKNSLATSGMVLGIIAASTAWIPFLGFLSLAVAVVGIPLAGIGWHKSNQSNIGRGKAIAGVILGAVAIIVWLLWLLVWGAAMAESGNIS